MGLFLSFVDSCDTVVSHGTGFDSQWFNGGSGMQLPYLDRPWFCTMRAPWEGVERKRGCVSLARLAAHFRAVNICPHRALPDAVCLAQCLARYEKLPELLASQHTRQPDETISID